MGESDQSMLCVCVKMTLRDLVYNADMPIKYTKEVLNKVVFHSLFFIHACYMNW